MTNQPAATTTSYGMFSRAGDALVDDVVSEAVGHAWPLGTTTATVTRWVQDQVNIRGVNVDEVYDTACREAIAYTIERRKPAPPPPPEEEVIPHPTEFLFYTAMTPVMRRMLRLGYAVLRHHAEQPEPLVDVGQLITADRAANP